MKIRCFFGSCPNSSWNLGAIIGCSCWRSWISQPHRSSIPSRQRLATTAFLWSWSLRPNGVFLRGSFGFAHCFSLSFPAGELSTLCCSWISLQVRLVLRAYWFLSISLTGFSSLDEWRPECMRKFLTWPMVFFAPVIQLKIRYCSKGWNSDQYTSSISYCCQWSSSNAQFLSLWRVLLRFQLLVSFIG